MARSLARGILTDAAGNAIQNALGYLYAQGTTTAVSDAYAAASGGSTVTTVTTNNQGEWTAWFTAPKYFDIKWTDNSNAAFYAGTSTLVDGADFTETHRADPPPADVALDIVAATWALRPAANTVVEGTTCLVTSQGISYRSDGTAWKRLAGDPAELWITDYGAIPGDSTSGTMTANVAAIRAAIAAAQANATTTGNATTSPSTRVCVPTTPLGGEYYINEAIAAHHVEIVGLSGTFLNTLGRSYRPIVNGINAVSGSAVFYADRDTDFPSQDSNNLTLRHLMIRGKTWAVWVKNSANFTWDDCDGFITDTSHAEHAVIYLENTFWNDVDGQGNGMRAGSASPVGADSNICWLRIVASDSGNQPIRGIGQSNFRNLKPDFGGVIFENRCTGSGNDSAGVGFENVVTENQDAQPFLQVLDNGASAAHTLSRWDFVRCERADAGGASAFFTVDCPTGARIVAEFFRVISTYPASDYIAQCFDFGDVRDLTVDGSDPGTGLVFDPANEPLNGLGIIQHRRGLAVRGTATAITLARAGNPSGSFVAGVSNNGDTHDRLGIGGNGTTYAGSGLAVADTTWGRGGAGFMFAPMLVKAGVPTDADYSAAPPNGTLAVNSSNSKMYARIAGSWVQVS